MKQTKPSMKKLHIATLLEMIIQDDDFIKVAIQPKPKMTIRDLLPLNQTHILVIYNNTLFDITTSPYFPFGSMEHPYHCVTATPYVLPDIPSYIKRNETFMNVRQAGYSIPIIEGEYHRLGIRVEDLFKDSLQRFKENMKDWKFTPMTNGGGLSIRRDKSIPNLEEYLVSTK